MHFPARSICRLLTDAERAAVGTRYKQCGQQAAIALGEELVSGATRTRAHRCVAQRSSQTHPGCAAVLLARRTAFADRSGVAARRRRRRRAHRRRLQGAAANVSAGRSKSSAPQRRCWCIAGRTGSGKTELLQRVRCDHRSGTPRESSRLRIRLQCHCTTDADRVREPAGDRNARGARAGRASSSKTKAARSADSRLPDPLHAAMQTAPLVVLEVPRDERVQRILPRIRRDAAAPPARPQRNCANDSATHSIVSVDVWAACGTRK